jgi:hypothetical protein
VQPVAGVEGGREPGRVGGVRDGGGEVGHPRGVLGAVRQHPGVDRVPDGDGLRGAVRPGGRRGDGREHQAGAGGARPVGEGHDPGHDLVGRPPGGDVVGADVEHDVGGPAGQDVAVEAGERRLAHHAVDEPVGRDPRVEHGHRRRAARRGEPAGERVGPPLVGAVGAADAVGDRVAHRDDGVHGPRREHVHAREHRPPGHRGAERGAVGHEGGVAGPRQVGGRQGHRVLGEHVGHLGEVQADGERPPGLRHQRHGVAEQVGPGATTAAGPPAKPSGVSVPGTAPAAPSDQPTEAAPMRSGVAP